MKRLFPILIVASQLLPVSAQLLPQRGGEAAQRPRPNVFRDAATHDTIVENRKVRPNPISELASVEVPEEAKAAKAYKPQSLLARSEVIKRGNVATLVPKRAVLHVPADLRGVLGMPESPQLINWAEFFLQNRSWIRTVEVTRNQAEGGEPLSEELIKSFEDCRQLVVATYQTGPISVLPYVEPEEPTETANVEAP